MAEAKLVLKPTFLGWLAVFPIAMNSILGGIGMLGFGFFAQHVSRQGIPLPIKLVFGVAFILLVFVIPWVAYVLKKRTYAQTEYRFFDDNLEYAEGFLTVENKSIRYDQIQETRMTRGLIQKKYGIGTILLKTAGQGPNAGVYIRDVENAEYLYERVKQIVSDNHRAPPATR